MAQVQRGLEGEREASPAHLVPPVEASGYGFGLFLVSRPDVGLLVGHGGGYPGYGTMMTWHPATGIGVVAAGNLRYAPVHDLARNALFDLVGADDLPRRSIQVLPAFDAHRATVTGLLERWDDDAADAAFAMNMDLDEPRDARRAAIAKAVEQVGRPLRPEPGREEVSNSAAHRSWWLRGERGWLRVAMLLSPEPEPRIQGLRLTPVLDASPGLAEVARRLLAGSGSGTWPAGLEAKAELDRSVVLRGLRVLAAWAGEGTPELGTLVAGDGATTATWEVGAPAVGTLRIHVDAATGVVGEVQVSAVERPPRIDAW
jgi:hypothetical protein